ncbi:MAG: FAD-dependent oxidoreductase [Promethearchaeota archaeon]
MSEKLSGTNVTGAVLVLGGGIAGISAAKNLAEGGYRVYMVEKAMTIGGTMAQLDKTFPTNDCSLCILAPKMVEVARDPNIDLLTNSELVKLEGEPGRYRATVLKKPRYVETAMCTACGDCAAACPVGGIPNEFDKGMGERHAVYIPFPSAVPATYAIDPEHCLHLTKGICGDCAKACKRGAINYDQKPEEVTIEVGAVIVATGFSEIKPETLGFFRQFREASPNVLVGMEYERLMCASGPTGGHIVRRSDGHDAKKIAFVQCVGSRNLHDSCAVPYCSRICCMYAAKEAIITKEHGGDDIECTIFNPESRSYEKNFQDYIDRAESEYGVRFVKGRVGNILASPGKHQIQVSFEDNATGETQHEDFDLAVLACAVVPSESAEALAKILGAELDLYRWYTPDSIEDMERRNIYICGCALTPTNIQESVAQAWAVSGKAMEKLSAARGTLVREAEYPEEKVVNPEDEPRIGVLVCRCGTNIGGYIDVPAVVDYVKKLPHVTIADENMYSCSSDSQETIKEMIRDNDLNRFIVSSCTPRTHEPLFRETLREAGVNPYLFELVNIRDQDSWVHMNEPEEATQKACDLIRMHVAKVAQLQPQHRQKIEVTKKILVVGGGLSGLEAALTVARQDIPVTIVEKDAELGGIWKDLSPAYDGSFSRDDLNELVAQVTKDPRITVMTKTKLVNLTGFVGNYAATLSSSGEENRDTFGGIVVATGVVQSEVPEKIAGEFPRSVVSQHEFEVTLQSKWDAPERPRIVFHQCAGQRGDPTVPGAFSGCGNICCEIAMKQAKKVLELYPDARVTILHRGMQLAWKPSEQFANELRRRVMFQRYDPGKGVEYSRGDRGIIVRYHDAEVGEDIEFQADVAVLATPFKPEDETRKLGPILKVPLTADGFFLEAHVKLRPLDFATDGIFLAGSAQYPKSNAFARMTGVGAAGRAVRLLSKGYVETEGITAEVDQDKCIGCLSCVDVCAFGAIQVVEVKVNLGSERYPKWKVLKKAQVVPASCKGCGTCVATCPKKAISQKHFRDNQILEMIEVFKEV